MAPKLEKTTQGKIYYCTISFNSAGRVTRDAPAEILVSACCQNWRDNFFFQQSCTNFGLHRSIIKKIFFFDTWTLLKVFGTSPKSAWRAWLFGVREGVRDAWLPNWTKWYSIISLRKFEPKISIKFIRIQWLFSNFRKSSVQVRTSLSQAEPWTGP